MTMLSTNNAVDGTIPSAAAGTLTNEMNRLASLIRLHTPREGVATSRISGLHFGRFSCVEGEQVRTFYQPSLGLVAQGAKAVTVGTTTFRIDSTSMFILPVALPLLLKTVSASSSQPLLVVRLDLDAPRIAEAALKVYPQGLPMGGRYEPAYTSCADYGIVNAVNRLVDCLAFHRDEILLAPLAMEEILIRLIRSPIGAMIAGMGFADSVVNRVARAVTWLRSNFANQMKVEDLAGLVHMSVSSFHEHFKSVTSVTPLQYQKALRLQEARRLMLGSQLDAATTARHVGYSSESQFSRDYSRYFGRPPKRDVTRLMQSSEIQRY